MASLSEKIRIDEREQIIRYIEARLHGLYTSSTACTNCLEDEMSLLLERLTKLNEIMEKKNA
jgi:hypothetical protein